MTTKAVAPAPAPLDASLWLNPASALLQGSTVLANLFRGAFDHWFSVVYSPNINIAGNAQVEGDVTTSVASYGRQLGIIAEALDELASGGEGEKLQRLRT